MFFMFIPVFGEDEAILTDIFQRAWNNQLDQNDFNIS